ncbi:MAG: NAD-dependent epimerase/dehydratase family protein [Rhodospirillaceae bacterium]|nr:NAD-dependent epimerase/dehydratase family protein [Rhodospirillaceae bacterium]
MSDAKPRAEPLPPGSLVAVTGATGFIGGHVMQALLDRGYAVRALTRRLQPAGHADVSWQLGDLNDADALAGLVAGAEAVIHLAGSIKALTRDDFFRANLDGTRHLAQAAARAAGRPRLVHVSSLAAREPRLSPYAASKRAAEQALRPFAEALPLAIVRPPAVYGPGDRETLRIFRLAARGIVPVPAVAGARFSLIHGADAAAAIVAALDLAVRPGATPEPWEPDDGRAGGYGWADVVAAAAGAVGRTPRLVSIPVPALYVGGLAGSLTAWLTRRPGMLTWSKVPELAHPDWVAVGGGVPGFTPRWRLPEGFANTVDWAISQGLLKSYR